MFSISSELAASYWINFEGGTLLAAVPNILDLITILALFCVGATEGKLSPVKGWRVGSRLTLELNSVRRCAVMSLMRSWRVDYYYPV